MTQTVQEKDSFISHLQDTKKKGGIRDHSLGSGIKALGIGISVFSMGSRIRRLDFVGSGIKIFITFGIRD